MIREGLKEEGAKEGKASPRKDSLGLFLAGAVGEDVLRKA